MPVTALGKPDKKAVRARFWEGAERAVGEVLAPSVTPARRSAAAFTLA